MYQKEIKEYYEAYQQLYDDNPFKYVNIEDYEVKEEYVITGDKEGTAGLDLWTMRNVRFKDEVLGIFDHKPTKEDLRKVIFLNSYVEGNKRLPQILKNVRPHSLLP